MQTAKEEKSVSKEQEKGEEEEDDDFELFGSDEEVSFSLRTGSNASSGTLIGLHV